MFTDELITNVRNLAQVPDTDEDITDEFILTQAYLGLLERFTQPIIMQRNGSWLHSYTFQTTAGVSRYRIPPRSITQGLEKIECAMAQGAGNADSSGWYLLAVQTNIQATDYEGWNTMGRPAAFTFTADTVELFPTPTTNWTLRMWYYLRPSLLVPSDLAYAEFASNVYAVTSLGGDQYSVQLDTVLDGAFPLLDFQYIDGNCEVLAVDVPNTLIAPSFHQCTLAPNQANLLTQAAASPFTNVVAKYSNTPTFAIPLPQEMQNALVSYVGAVVLAEKGDSEKAQVFSQKCELALKNLVDIAMPRAKGMPPVFRTRSTYLRRRVGRGGYGWGRW